MHNTTSYGHRIILVLLKMSVSEPWTNAPHSPHATSHHTSTKTKQNKPEDSQRENVLSYDTILYPKSTAFKFGAVHSAVHFNNALSTPPAKPRTGDGSARQKKLQIGNDTKPQHTNLKSQMIGFQYHSP